MNLDLGMDWMRIYILNYAQDLIFLAKPKFNAD